MRKRLDFPRGYGQLHGGSCGPNIMRRVISYKRGLDVIEEDLINLGNCSVKKGTSIDGIANIADKFGLNYLMKTNSSISDLIQSIKENNPVVLLIQAWPEKKVKDWTKVHENGHYVGVFGFDEKEEKIFYYDPLGGKEKDISYKNLLERWHDGYNNFGIFFK
jgi:uncharacterized protein YvpB